MDRTVPASAFSLYPGPLSASTLMARGMVAEDEAIPLGWWECTTSTSSSYGSGSMLDARRFRGEEER